MREFFRGWRRKFGCATLFMALVFMAGWVRGSSICDVADFGSQGGYYRLNASCYGLMWFRNEGDPNIAYGDPFQLNHHPVGSANGPHPGEFHLGDDETERVIQWHWHWAGFHFAKTVWIRDGMRKTLWVVPYWSIVLPLTALSAFLLTPAHRQSTPMNAVESSPENGI